MEKIKQAIDEYLKEHPEKSIMDVAVGIDGGLGYKPGTDDVRNSPTIMIINKLKKNDIQLEIVEHVKIDKKFQIFLYTDKKRVKSVFK